MNRNTNLDIWISGAVAVVTVDFLVYPFDTLKTRIQSPHYDQIYKDARTGAIRKNILFRGLYQGVSSVVLSTIPASGAFFTTYEAVKFTLNKSSSHSGNHSPCRNRLVPFAHSASTPVINAISSSVAEMVSCLMLTPAEVIKQNAQVINITREQEPTHQQLQEGNGHSLHNKRRRYVTLEVLSRFRKTPWKLWSGYTALVGRNLPFTGLNFPIFEYVKGRLVGWREEKKKKKRTRELDLRATSATSSGVLAVTDGDAGLRGEGKESVWERALLTGMAASVSGSIAAVVTTPIDVVKTRMMLAASDGGSPVPGDGVTGRSGGIRTRRRSGAWVVGRRTLQNEGLKGLFRGGAIRVIWTAVSLSIYLSIYESGRFYLEEKRRQKHGSGGMPVENQEGEPVV